SRARLHRGQPRPARKFLSPPFPEASVGPPPAPSPVLTYSPTPTGQTGDTFASPLGFWRAEVTFLPRLRLCLPLPQSTERLFAVSLVSPSPASHSLGFSLSVSSPVSKQRKNVISCVTVHDSPYSDSSSITSPYAVQHCSGHSATAFDTKGSLESHCTGNPRTIIVPPLKTQASEALVECDSLGPVTTSHHSSSYKSKSSSNVTSTSGHSSGSSSGATAYRQQRPLNLSQAQQHITADRTGSHRRQQAYITPTMAQAPYSFPHNSPSHGTVHPHLAAAAHLPAQPHLYTYTAPAALGSTGTVAHLVASQGSARHAVQHTAYPASIVHQVPVSMGPRVLPSPTIHPSQYPAQFAHQTYISASPASTVYTGYPLSPAKISFLFESIPRHVA
ncbi:homeodomain-interacting protein kinase 2-like, partial [Physeter macrocephalus]|uniref:Homeodomain-interacting protein kinase 2-like n=1 Tax=Physeter macrocephalus TaxID=9755 RepID=A0A455BFF5_PHYMC